MRTSGSYWNITKLAAGLCAVGAAAMSAHGQATWIDEFTGEFSENLLGHPNNLQQGCLMVFEDHAELCPLSGVFWLTNNWSSLCPLTPPANSKQIGGTSAGMRFEFRAPIERFGAWFAVAQGEAFLPFLADFFDENGVLIMPRIEVPDLRADCNWYWNGWEFDVPVAAIEFRSSFGANGAWATLGGQWQIDLWDGAGCYPDCDENETLDFFDFLCFQNAFLAGDPYADCDGNTVLDFFDFLCFQNEFLAGC